VLTDEFQVKLPAIGAALSKFFGVPYEPFKPDRIKPLDLLKNLKRDYVESNQWVPIEEAKEGLVILCLDPERVKSSRIVQNVFPSRKLVYRVTSLKEFKDTLKAFYGAEAADSAISAICSRAWSRTRSPSRWVATTMCQLRPTTNW
jgi:hypothetical protein